MKVLSGLAESAVNVGPRRLPGMLSIPPDAEGLVLFAHGSGSSRLSPRNRYVAQVLQQSGLATLLFDLLSDQEARSQAMVFDISLLADRLAEAALWATLREETASLPAGFFGASTGAAAALAAAERLGGQVRAVVSRGGRPDLAKTSLARVMAPTLLIVGGRDEAVLDLNRAAYELLTCEKRLDVVPGATHLFSEPGALEQAAALAAQWFKQHLKKDA